MGAQCVSRVRATKESLTARVDTRPAITPEQRDTPACGHASRARTRRTRNSNTREQREKKSFWDFARDHNSSRSICHPARAESVFSLSFTARAQPFYIVRTFVRPDGGLRVVTLPPGPPAHL